MGTCQPDSVVFGRLLARTIERGAYAFDRERVDVKVIQPLQCFYR